MVASNGKLTQLFDATFPSIDGMIRSVAINNSGMGIIGGQDNTGTMPAYAALVSPTGTLTNLFDATFPSTDAVITSVAINNSGSGIIGGQQDGTSGPAYAALVSPTGVLTNLLDATFPSTSGVINSVAINDSGWGIIGGEDQEQDLSYAALVSPSGDLIPFSGGNFPLNNIDIISVAINNSKWGIIGGSRNSGYAALVTPNNDLIELFEGGVDLNLSILSVAINNSNMAIIGGKDFRGPEFPYAALVAQDGTLTTIPTTVFPSGVQVESVAINDAGVAILGVNMSTSLQDAVYAILIAPNGAITNISRDNFSFYQTASIRSVAISDKLIETTVPKSFGPGSSFANAIFPLTSQVLPNHAMYHHKASYNQPQVEADPNFAIGLLADATDAIQTSTPCLQAANYSIWFTPFGTYAHQKEDQNFVALTNWIGGGMLGFDYRGIRDTVIGIGSAYAYNYVDYSESAGRAHFHQGFLTLYGSWNRKNLFINAALWGGYYRLYNKRNTLHFITSTANVNGWQLTAHLELSAPFHPLTHNWFVIDPFIMADWISNWQGSVGESGPSGLNIYFGSAYTSLLRTEIGFRFFESLRVIFPAACCVKPLPC
ncbi:MAG: autotransporter outer membrane beta-barrel domain-containing protein [Chlamydiota bacterium]